MGTVEEWAKRHAIFKENMLKVAEMNAEHVLINGEAVYGVTKFSDLTVEEFENNYLGYVPSNATKTYVDVRVDGPAANDIDWVSKGAVTPVKDQGRCGSCWAFSATTAIESYAELAGKGLKVLSAQQINSCDKRDGGCNGGNTETAYQYVKGAGGIELNSDYPYTSGGGQTGSCKFNSGRIAVSISGYHSVSRGESALKNALNEGPASVCLAASVGRAIVGVFWSDVIIRSIIVFKLLVILEVLIGGSVILGALAGVSLVLSDLLKVRIYVKCRTTLLIPPFKVMLVT